MSYFIRAAAAYDTLLQMGRWFGYRRGYEDLPRVWMTSELEDWFGSARTCRARGSDKRSLVTKGRGLRPSTSDADVLRTHPALAIIPAAAEMRSAVWAKVSFGGRLVQTITFEHRNPAVLAANRTAVETVLVRQSADQCSMKGPEARNPRCIRRRCPSVGCAIPIPSRQPRTEARAAGRLHQEPSGARQPAKVECMRCRPESRQSVIRWVRP